MTTYRKWHIFVFLTQGRVKLTFAIRITQWPSIVAPQKRISKEVDRESMGFHFLCVVILFPSLYLLIRFLKNNLIDLLIKSQRKNKRIYVSLSFFPYYSN